MGRLIVVIFAVLCGLFYINRSTSPTAANLVYQDMGVSESTFPVIVAVQVENLGSELPVLKGVKGDCTFSFVIAGPGDASLVPDGFQWELQLADPSDTMGQPDSPDIIPFVLDWTANNVPLDLLAVVQMTFEIEYDDAKSVTTEPVVFLVGNNPKVQAGIARGGFSFNEDHEDLAKQIESLEGGKSKQTMLLVEKLKQARE